MEKGGKFEMKEERFLKLTYIHDIATIVSIFLSVFHVMKGTGSKIRDVLCGSFLVMQIFAALKIGARFFGKEKQICRNPWKSCITGQKKSGGQDGNRPCSFMS